MKLITIKEAKHAVDLSILKGRLESEGIPCYIKDGLTSQVLNHLMFVTASLQISDEHIEQAKKIMLESGELVEENVELTCPKCGSEKVKVKLSIRNIGRIAVALLSVLFTSVSAGNTSSKTKFRCLSCRHEFI